MRALGLPLLSLAAALGCVLAACGPAGVDADWPPLARKWFDRAQASYRQADFEDATLAVDNALRVDPRRGEIRLLAAEVALADLDYDRAIRAVEGLTTSEARGIRGRALWYSGQVDRAADELEALVQDPEVRDPWATEVAKLARRGVGRTPFRTSGGLLAVSPIPVVGPSAFVVPVELDGEEVLGVVATGTPEVMIDSAGGRQPSWVSLRFGGRVEVKDVPALTRDMADVSRQLNAPIKVLLGVNLLRHLRPTFDFEGSQFVVRTFDPPPPRQATTARVSYIRGGGMMLRVGVGPGETQRGSFLVDTLLPFPFTLDDGGWKRAGIDVRTLQPVPNGGKLRSGLLSRVLVGAFDVPQVPAVYDASLDALEKSLGVDLDGKVGAGFLAAFRVTLVDGGKTLWLEDTVLPGMSPAPPPEESAPPAAPPGAASAPAPS
jgi:hypothetical protein